jgi:hypothetical protein
MNHQYAILFYLCGKQPIEFNLKYHALSLDFKFNNCESNFVLSVVRHVLRLSGSHYPLLMFRNTLVCTTAPDLFSNFDCCHILATAGNGANFV